MTADINFTKGDVYPDIVVMKWTGSVSRAKQQAGATDGRDARRSPTGQARSGDRNGTAGNVRNDDRESSASQLADIGRELILDGKSFNTAGLRAILTMVCRALPALSRHSIPLR